MYRWLVVALLLAFVGGKSTFVKGGTGTSDGTVTAMDGNQPPPPPPK
jgi:hypothetical protein